MNVTVNSIKDWADTVKEAFFVNNMEPNDMVEEIARANDLNSDQVSRVCQASNLAIKMASRQGKIDNVMFPLASPAEVQSRIQSDYEWEGTPGIDKTASLAPESRVGEFCKFFLTERSSGGMTKIAGTEELSARASNAIFRELEGRYKTARRSLASSKSEASKEFMNIIEYISDEVKIARNMNFSYTAASMVIGTDVVDDIYKIAHPMVCNGLGYPYPKPEFIKTGNLVVNPKSEIITSIQKYASLLQYIEDKEEKLKKIDDERKIASKNFQEVMLKET